MKPRGGYPDKPLDLYRETSFRPEQDSERFLLSVGDGVARRRRQREARRQMAVALTSILLLVVVLRGVGPASTPALVSDLTARVERDALAQADSVLDELASEAADQRLYSFFSYLNSEQSLDPTEGLAMYDDAVVEQAMQKLATFDPFGSVDAAEMLRNPDAVDALKES